MPSDEDLEVLRDFLSNTADTYHFVVAEGRLIRGEDGGALLSAIGEFREVVEQRLLTQYADADEADSIDSGVFGQQLRAKRDLARRASGELVPRRGGELDQEGVPRRRRLSKGNVRRWIKRAKVLAGSLKGLVPAGEALVELLDLLDGALDVRR